MNAFEIWKLRFEPISPIHIGSGEAVDPMEYIIIEQGQNTYLACVNLHRLLARITPAQRQELMGLIERTHMPAIRQWLNHHALPQDYRFVVQIMANVARELIDKIDSDNASARVDLFARHADTGLPYLPGSSIKGAIRTAVIQHWITKEKQYHDQCKNMARESNSSGGAAFEAYVMGNLNKNGKPELQRDPFRQLALTDIHLPADGCYIDKITIKRNPRSKNAGKPDPSGILMYRDLTWSMMDGESVCYDGELRLHTGLAQKKAVQRALELDVPLILQACNDFYPPILREQLKQLQDWGVNVQGNEGLQYLTGMAQDGVDAKKGSCLIRLGRHSHFEAVTFRPPHHQPPRFGYGKTRSMANAGQWPLGWARLSLAQA